MDDTTPVSSDITPPTGPGRLLRQARQDLRLAPEDVAQILHLSPKQIVALEQDDFKNLPGPTYVRGYLRGYAQLLGLSPEKVIESYNALTIPPKPLSLPKSAPPPQITSSDRLVKAATVAVVAIVLGLVYLWWRAEGEAPEPAKPLSSAVAPEAAKGAATPEIATIPPEAGGIVIVPADSPAPVLTQPPAAPAPSPAVKSAPVSGQVTVSGMILNVSPAEPAKPAGPAAPAHTDRALARTRQAADIPPGAPRARLVLHAVQESWADIRDAQDNKLLYETVPAGRSVTIEGAAPLSVFLGNAEGVRVEFNGQNYDVSKHKRGQVARFTLGENTAVNN